MARDRLKVSQPSLLWWCGVCGLGYAASAMLLGVYGAADPDAMTLNPAAKIHPAAWGTIAAVSVFVVGVVLGAVSLLEKRRERFGIPSRRDAVVLLAIPVFAAVLIAIFWLTQQYLVGQAAFWMAVAPSLLSGVALAKELGCRALGGCR